VDVREISSKSQQKEEVEKMTSIIHIYPRDLSFLSSFNNAELLLYHEAIRSEEYVKFFSNIANYKILDNSFYELRKEVPYDELIEVGEQMGVNEIILPDKLWDGEWTRNAVKDNLRNYYEVYKKNGWKVAAVVQGKDEEDIAQTLDMYINDDRINVIMVPRKLIKCETYYAGRLKWWLNNYAKVTGKEVHFLGANSWGDFSLPIKSKIRSMDTKLFAKTILHQVIGPSATKWQRWDEEIFTDPLQIVKARNLANYLKSAVYNYYGEV
jgi:hypothetical protein